ncbi:putative lymphocyte antigen 6D-like [Scophthalmus maximus]|uniref:Putative lymphocyte antigen 6D-like n=1 Tax=Scophthalmus maximus TaxID=52904 RepID=A0A2U9B667_SCOMX|nr:putative lymphocyte antigen 6D-like [Scophthalmus maximus]
MEVMSTDPTDHKRLNELKINTRHLLTIRCFTCDNAEDDICKTVVECDAAAIYCKAVTTADGIIRTCEELCADDNNTTCCQEDECEV